MKNAFYFTLNTLFVLKTFRFYIPNFFNHVGKCLVKKAMVNFKIYDASDWETNNYNTHIALYLKK